MKLLNKRISEISKLVLLFSLCLVARAETLVTQDRFLIKILDSTISYQDISFQVRNLEALHCVYSDAFIIQYFGKKFLGEIGLFVKNFPKDEDKVKPYLHQQEEVLKKLRVLFKMLRYTSDQKGMISQTVTELIKESTQANKCDPGILHKEDLKTNFKNLLESELYLRSRYGGQLKSSGSQNFEVIRGSIDLFIDSLDKQFVHEYYW
ncbi:MAG: hypothetical protein AB7I27_02505 [Bacteriovoracaceae bacterium]